MAEPRKPDESVSLGVLHNNPGEAVDRVRYQDRHIEVTRKGRPAAMLVPIGWWRRAVIALDHAAELTADDIEAWHENDETGAPDDPAEVEVEHQGQAAAPAEVTPPTGEQATP